MIAALFALAAAMAIGGCAAVVQGFPYVRLESGLAMVIAGSVTASSGAVLFGIGVLALRVRRIERAMGRVPGSGPVPVLGPSEALPAAAEGSPRTSPVLPAAPAFIVPPVVEPPYDPDRLRIEPGLNVREDTPPLEVAKAAEPRRPEALESDFPLHVPPPASPLAASASPVLAPAPPLLHAGPDRNAPEASPASPGERALDDDLFAAPEPTRETGEALPSLRPGLDAAPDPEPAPTPDARTVVGRYASGGNTYVMFEDGAIEAETPQGRFTFGSLDELKAFVDGGGESGSRGAA